MEVAIFQIVVLIFSVIIHELAHGFTADRLGDSTARNAGRLTLNPLRHLDPIGSVLLPLLTYFAGGFIFGYAKPVPYNSYNLKNPKRDGALIALAGPASNFLIAFVFGFIYRFGLGSSLLPAAFGGLSAMVVVINVLLGIFNLVPIPPLDGSKILFALLPDEMQSWQRKLEQYGMLILVFFLFFGFRLIAPAVYAISALILGA